ncbi:unnamed protein product, partial [Hymenolepis diminuta]
SRIFSLHFRETCNLRHLYTGLSIIGFYVQTWICKTICGEAVAAIIGSPDSSHLSHIQAHISYFVKMTPSFDL